MSRRRASNSAMSSFLVLRSLAGGLLYEWHAASPWGFLLAATGLALALTVFFVRDPKNAEV
jgi:hypothetical protein